MTNKRITKQASERTNERMNERANERTSKLCSNQHLQIDKLINRPPRAPFQHHTGPFSSNTNGRTNEQTN